MKRHLLKATGVIPSMNRAACGMRAPPQYTDNPAQVTCLGCAKTLYMADAEFRQKQRRTRKNRRQEQPE